MKKQIFERIKEVCDFHSDELIVVGVSGGADSVCLLDCFHKMGYKLVIAHFNHQLRLQAKNDALFVEKISKQLGLPFELGTSDVKEYAEESHKSIEEAARILRYQFLMKIANKYHSKYIAVAHNADDQVETVMMHLIRGSGISGLTGMKEKTIIDEFDKEIVILRPLLSVWRSEIEDYLQNNEMTYREDETNFDLQFTRNQIRYDLIPGITKKYPKFKEQIWQTAFLLSEDKEIIDRELEKAWDEIIDQSKKGIIRCIRSDFLKLGLGLQRHLLRKMVFFLQPSIRDISFESIQRGIDGIYNDQSGIIDLEGNLCVELTDNSYYVFEKNVPWAEQFFPQINEDKLISIDGNRMIEFGKNWILKTELIEKVDPRYFINKSDPNIIEIDYLAVKDNQLKISKKDPGDRFSPFGMSNNTIKIGEFFINEKIPKSARNNWPLLKDMDGKIIWVMGLRLSEEFKITPETKKIIRFELFQQLIN